MSQYSSQKPGISTAVTMTNGDVLKARSIRDVRIDLGGSMTNIRDVLHVPGLDANLLSALNRRDFNVMFNGVEIQRGDTLVGTGIRRWRMYLLRSVSMALFINEAGQTIPISQEVVGAKLSTNQRGHMTVQKNPKKNHPACVVITPAAFFHHEGGNWKGI